MTQAVYLELLAVMKSRRGPYAGLDIPEFFDLVKTLFTPEEAAVNNVLGKQPETHDAMKPGGKIRVLLADDHASMSRELKPSVVLMNIDMPKLNGIEAAPGIHSELPEIRTIGLSMHDEDDIAEKIIEAGAAAYCVKGGDNGVLLSAIRGEAEGAFL